MSSLNRVAGTYVLRAINHRGVAWLAALAWTVLVCFLMLTPADDNVVEDTSSAFGGTDLTDAVGHVILFAALAGVWFNALRLRWPPRRAWWITRVGGLALATALELAQTRVPDRGASWLDLGANWLGILGLTWWLARYRHTLARWVWR